MIPVVCYYSYKGGAGRTSTCYNTLPFLIEKFGASPDKPILVVDADLDSAGLTYLFGYVDRILRNECRDVMDSLEGGALAGARGDTFLRSLPDVSARLDADRGTVKFLGTIDSNRRGQRENANSDEGLNSRSFDGFSSLISACEDNAYSAVVFDLASGTQKSSLVLQELSNIFVCCMRATHQFTKGTFDYLTSIAESARLNNNVLILVPVSIPLEDSNEKTSAISVITNEARTPEIENGHFILDTTLIEVDTFGIPEVNLLKWRETLLSTIRNRQFKKDEEIAIQRYELLAERIYSAHNTLNQEDVY